jgi:hypothetical protein
MTGFMFRAYLLKATLYIISVAVICNARVTHIRTYFEIIALPIFAYDHYHSCIPFNLNTFTIFFSSSLLPHVGACSRFRA